MITTVGFSIVLAVVFATWFAFERTLSIHTIYTTRREAFYWLAVLFTFALGTAAGDLTAERLNLGYLVSLLLFAGLIAAVAGAHYLLDLNAIAAFWIAYILTRPLGASLGDYLSQPRADGGLGLGTTVTSAHLPHRDPGRRRLPQHHPEGRDRARTGARRARRPRPRGRAQDRRDARAPRRDPARGRPLGPARFHLLVPNPAEHAEITEAERQHAHTEGEHVLALALPLIDQAAGGEADGSVSIRHDPMDAIEEALDGARVPRDHPLDPPAEHLPLAPRRPPPPRRPPRAAAHDRGRRGARPAASGRARNDLGVRVTRRALPWSTQAVPRAARRLQKRLQSRHVSPAVD